MRRHDPAVCRAHRLWTPTQEIRDVNTCIPDCVAVGHLFAWCVMQAYLLIEWCASLSRGPFSRLELILEGLRTKFSCLSRHTDVLLNPTDMAQLDLLRRWKESTACGTISVSCRQSSMSNLWRFTVLHSMRWSLSLPRNMQMPTCCIVESSFRNRLLPCSRTAISGDVPPSCTRRGAHRLCPGTHRW